MGAGLSYVLELEDLVVAQRNGDPVVRATLQLSPGEIATVSGPSGIGKSTLVRGIVGLSPVIGGLIRFDGGVTSTKALRAHVRVVHQTGALDPNQRVYAAIRRSAKLAGCDCDIAALLSQVQLPKLEDRPCSALSGGERMRVALARALAAQPRVLILDELTRGLDPPTAHQLLTMIKHEARTGTACLAMTHNPSVRDALGAVSYALVGPAPAELVRSAEST